MNAVLIPLAPDSVNVPYERRLCSRADTSCRMPKPFTTRGEVRALAAVAAEHHCDSAVIITQTAQLSRARMLTERCFPGTILVQDSGEPPSGGGWLYQIPYQTAAAAKALLVRDC